MNCINTCEHWYTRNLKIYSIYYIYYNLLLLKFIKVTYYTVYNKHLSDNKE